MNLQIEKPHRDDELEGDAAVTPGLIETTREQLEECTYTDTDEMDSFIPDNNPYKEDGLLTSI